MRRTNEHLDRRWTALILLCVAQFVVVLDASIVNVALPSIGRQGVSFAISHYQEAYTRITDELYSQLLDREADAQGQAAFKLPALVLDPTDVLILRRDQRARCGRDGHRWRGT